MTTFFCWALASQVEAFDSGSTGALGAFNPSANTTVTLPPDGILNYTTVNIPSGVTVTFARNAANTAVTLVATGDITIAGTLEVSGQVGPPTGWLPAQGGPGGFAGGIGGAPAVGGAGPGGGTTTNFSTLNATYGAPSAFVSLTPLFGGSGGAGGPASTLSAAGGGGGGGAIVLASNTRITMLSTGQILAKGGNGATSAAGAGFNAGGGSGGAIRLVAPEVTTSGQLVATGGLGTLTQVPAGSGRIRIEATTLSLGGSISPAASTDGTLGPITPASTPSTSGLPSLTISSVGGVVAPVLPSGSYAQADMPLPPGTANPVPVTITATNVPVPTPFTIQVIPQVSGPTSVSGTLTGPVGTAFVTLPRGEAVQLLVFASFTAPAQLVAWLSTIDGDPVDRVLVAGGYGIDSRLILISRSGRAVSVGEDLSIPVTR